MLPCPSAADPGRNKHRSGAGWTLGSVATILQNPRDTGRQGWNRQRTDTELADPGNVTLGHKSVPRWNLPDGWVISNPPAHPALVSETDFIAAQDINAARDPAPQDAPARWRRTRPSRRTPTCARTSSFRTCKPCTSCSPPRDARPAPNPCRSRCQGHCEPGQGNRLPARARDHPHLEPGRRCLASTRRTDCQDRNCQSKLTRLQSPDQEGRRARNADRLALAEAHARVTSRHARKQATIGFYCVRRLHQIANALRVLSSFLTMRGNSAVTRLAQGWMLAGVLALDRSALVWVRRRSGSPA